MRWTLSTTDRHWRELAHLLHEEWQGGCIDPQRVRELAAELLPASPDMRHTLTHLARRMAPPRH